MDKVDPSAGSILNSVLVRQMGVPSELRRNRGSPVGTKKAGRGEGLRGSNKALFSDFLEKSFLNKDLGPPRELSPSEEALTELMDEVHSAGSDLADRPFPEEILRYKKAVRNFVHYVVENSLEVEKVQGIKKKVVTRGEAEWKPMVYHHVKVIDKKLEELAAAILSGQSKLLERVSKIDEISGLLVDLTITGVIRERDE